MTFPVMPVVPAYAPPAPTWTYIGQNYNSADGFPTGAQTLTAGTKVVIVACQLAGGPAASGVTVGGLACTQACASGAASSHASIWYLQTSLSGSQTISGSGGSGRSILHVYEMRGYSSSTPYSAVAGFVDTASSSFGIDLPTSSNTTTFGAGMAGPVTIALTPSVGPAVNLISNVAVESATTHFSWVQSPTVTGSPTTYTGSGSATSWRLAAAAWR